MTERHTFTLANRSTTVILENTKPVPNLTMTLIAEELPARSQWATLYRIFEETGRLPGQEADDD